MDHQTIQLPEFLSIIQIIIQLIDHSVIGHVLTIWLPDLSDNEPGLGIGSSGMLGTGNFPNFFRNYPVPGNWHSGTQTSILARFSIQMMV